MMHKFFVLMGVSSSLTLVRGFVVASLVSLHDFGIFAVLIAVGLFSSTLLGLGQIEGTMKAFPRAWNVGLGRQVCLASDALTRKIIGRAVAVVVLACAIFYSTGHTERLEMVGMVAGISIGAAMMGVYSSLLRASGNLKELGRSTFARSFMALIFCTAGAFTLGWQGAVIGEFLASVLGALQARYAGRRLIKPEKFSDDQHKDDKLLLSQSFSGGRWLLFAMFVTSVPFYLDRLFIATIFGSSVAGQYGFLMLLVTGASTFSGIIVQKVGPDLVKGAQINMGLYLQCRIAFRWMSIHTILVTVGIGAFSALTLMGPLNFLGERYQVSASLILVTLLIATMQCSVILDWLLLSRDEERLVFAAAIIYFCILSIFVLFIVLTKDNATLIEIMAYIAFSKFGHILSQSLLIMTKVRGKKIGA
jgi:hypothetical protein